MIQKKVKLNVIEDVKSFTVAAADYAFDIDVRSGKYVIDAKSLMGLFSLNLSEPVNVEIFASEAEAEEFLNKIKELII